MVKRMLFDRYYVQIRRESVTTMFKNPLDPEVAHDYHWQDYKPLVNGFGSETQAQMNCDTLACEFPEDAFQVVYRETFETEIGECSG